MFFLLLSGRIPPELGNLAALRQLYLGRNQLTGECFVEISRMNPADASSGFMHVAGTEIEMSPCSDSRTHDLAC